MIVFVKVAQYVDDYRILVTFNTDESAVVDFTPFIHEMPGAEALKDIEMFKSFYLDGWPTLAWPCGYDIAPETLYQLATGKLPPWATTPMPAASSKLRTG